MSQWAQWSIILHTLHFVLEWKGHQKVLYSFIHSPFGSVGYPENKKHIKEGRHLWESVMTHNHTPVPSKRPHSRVRVASTALETQLLPGRNQNSLKNSICSQSKKRLFPPKTRRRQRTEDQGGGQRAAGICALRSPYQRAQCPAVSRLPTDASPGLRSWVWLPEIITPVWSLLTAFHGDAILISWATPSVFYLKHNLHVLNYYKCLEILLNYLLLQAHIVLLHSKYHAHVPLPA